MKNTAPHYLLLTEAEVHTQNSAPGGRWRFVLEEMAGEDRVEVSEREPNVWGERLELLSIVRGLEALEQPSKVTLITASKYAGRRIRHGFAEWKASDWCWECFGEMKPVKYVELWKRIDAAMQFHQVECRIWQWTRPLAERNARQSSKRVSQRFEYQEGKEVFSGEECVDHPLASDRKIVFKRRQSGPRVEEADFNYVKESRPNVLPALTPKNVFDDRDFFRASRSKTPRVVEIDPDLRQPVSFPQAFGCTIN